MYDSEFSDRLDIVIKKIGTIGEACKQAGISYPTITRWKEGTSDPKISNIIALAKAGNVSLDWLIFGIGNNKQDLTTKEINKNDEYVYIPFYDIQASAGIGLFTEGATAPTKHLAFRKRWITEKGLQANKLIALHTQGDSMEPTIKDGAIIIINTNETKVTDGKLHVIRIEDELYIKRVQRIPQGIRLISDNKKMYDPLDVKWEDYTPEQLQICGQLIHTSYDL